MMLKGENSLVVLAAGEYAIHVRLCRSELEGIACNAEQLERNGSEGSDGFHDCNWGSSMKYEFSFERSVGKFN